MTQENSADLIRMSWAKAMASREMVAMMFYRKLFQLRPDLEPLFKNDIDEQGRKLVDTLSFIVDSLDDPDGLLSAASDLATRHVSYGVSADQYAPVGEALIMTLSELLGSDFTEAEKNAWLETYTTLSSHMISSAYGED